MNIRYLKELSDLDDVYKVAVGLDVEPLRDALATAASRPAVMLGSGGSYSAASFAAFLHQLKTSRLASASTPLDYMTLPLRDAAVMCFTASGRNKDICAAFDEAAQREARPLIGLVMRETSPLHDLSGHYGYSRIASFASEKFEDGFLAVASLLASSVVLLRAYRALIGDPSSLPATLDQLMARTASVPLKDMMEHVERPLIPTTTSLLYSSSLRPASIDTESRFVEAALGNIHGSDFRNFGHGRHHWFAKRLNETGIIALVGDDQEALATRTLALIPEPVPTARIDFRGPRDEQALAGLVTSLHIAATAGRLRGIDPGKPGVPEFGRRLYHLAPSLRRKARATDPTETAVWRKERTAGLKTTEQLAELHSLCRQGIERLRASRFAGFVFDYDGTLCEPHARFKPLSPLIGGSLNKLLSQGAIIGIATGRGGSAAERLGEVVKKEFWDNVIIGFYNGAIISSLRNGPPAASKPNHDIECLEQCLRASGHFKNCSFRSNVSQIAISLPTLEEPIISVRAAMAVVEGAGVRATVTCSSHSIDVIFGQARKSVVVDAVRRYAGAAVDAPVLRIGDKGRWPGNDAELLDDPFGLSVDEVSPSTQACWGLSPRGVLGVQAMNYYLDRINWKQGAGLIHFD